MKISGSLACKYQKVSAELIKYKDRNFKYKQTISNLQARVKNLSKKLETDKIKYEEKIKELEAIIKTYIETCRRNHINEIDALKRLCSGNPYKVSEIFSSGK